MGNEEILNGLRTYRPNLEDYVFCNSRVQQEVTSWVEGLKSGKSCRSLMLSGPSGTGKTTLAKALAKALNSRIIEYNCGTSRTLEFAREVTSNLNNMPMIGDYNIILLDEVHQLVENAQEAFLTPLENLPSSTIVIACTTEPDNLKKTFLGRFYQVKNERYTREALFQILKNLPVEKLKKETIEYAISVARGIPRDAIGIVEKSLQDGELSTQELQEKINQETIKQKLDEFILAELVTFNYLKLYALCTYLDESNYENIADLLLQHLDKTLDTTLGVYTIYLNKNKKYYEDLIVKIGGGAVNPTAVGNWINLWYPVIVELKKDGPLSFKTKVIQTLTRQNWGCS